MKIIALISVYQEENLLQSCIESARYLDERFVFDGPIEADVNFRDTRNTRSKLTVGGIRYKEYKGYWKTDADKRTDILLEAQAWDEDAWALWLDGDEILLYGEYLKDHCQRAEQETATGGSTIRIVEYDGSVAQCYGKLIKLSSIKEYIMSSYEVELANGMTVALPNVPICTAGGIPIGEIKERNDPLLALNRPPLIGEPHLLHRHGLRNPEREAPRLHNEEEKSFSKLVKSSKEKNA